MFDKNACLVVLSGGQDSTLCLGFAKSRYSRVMALMFDYGQRHKTELDAAVKVAESFGVDEYEVVKVHDSLKGTSPLVSNTTLEQYSSFEQMSDIIGDRQELTFVPMRNDLFLTIAYNRAFVNRVGNVMIGVCGDDEANYDDCRAEYLELKRAACCTALGLATSPTNDSNGQTIALQAPILRMSKKEIVEAGIGVKGVYKAWSLSQTAYDGKYPPMGKDHASVLRARGFEDAGVPDPLVVRAWIEGLMDLPWSSNYNVLKQNKIHSIDDLAAAIGAK